MKNFIRRDHIESWKRILLHIKCLIIRPSKWAFFFHGIKREFDHLNGSNFIGAPGTFIVTHDIWNKRSTH